MKPRKIALTLAVVLFTMLMGEYARADGFSNWAVPTQMITTGDGGIVVEGAFANSNNTCTERNSVIVKGDTNQLKLVEAMVLTALVTQKAMRFYMIGCDASYDNVSMGLVYNSRYVSIK